MQFRHATFICSQAYQRSLRLLFGFALFALALGCGGAGSIEVVPPESGFTRYRATAPSTREDYCAWYADRLGEILYFGTSAFWSRYRESDFDPQADLQISGPRQIGRFDLARERFLSPIVLGEPNARSGVWDVLVHPPSGQTFFTSLFGRAGIVGFGGRDFRLLDEIASGLNELANGPHDRIVASRYWGPAGQGGSVVLLGRNGELLAEHPLESAEGFFLAPKTVAYDPSRKLIWVNTDRLAANANGVPASLTDFGGAHHPTLVLDLDGRELARINSSEIQAFAFEKEGRGAFALIDEGRLELLILEPGEPLEAIEHGRRILIDDAFPGGFDFVQDLVFDRRGDILLTRWSGRIHRITSPRPAQRTYVQTLDLPRYQPDGLYYAAAIRGRRICATYCGGVSVVCGPTSSFRARELLPAASARPR